MAATMLIKVANQQNEIVDKEVKTKVLTSTNTKEVVEFLKSNCTTAGFSVQYAVNPQTKKAIEIFKKGKLTQKEVKPLIEEGFIEFHYSWAWASKRFKMESGEIVEAALLDLVKIKDVMPFKGLFGF
jgi:polyhydroxyalkanoate synthesis regulator phasin